jgi:hypothetical protein
VSREGVSVGPARGAPGLEEILGELSQPFYEDAYRAAELAAHWGCSARYAQKLLRQLMAVGRVVAVKIPFARIDGQVNPVPAYRFVKGNDEKVAGVGDPGMRRMGGPGQWVGELGGGMRSPPGDVPDPDVSGHSR